MGPTNLYPLYNLYMYNDLVVRPAKPWDPLIYIPYSLYMHNDLVVRPAKPWDPLIFEWFMFWSPSIWITVSGKTLENHASELEMSYMQLKDYVRKACVLSSHAP